MEQRRSMTDVPERSLELLYGKWTGMGHRWNWKTREEAAAITWVRGDGDLSEGGSREWGRWGKKWLGSGAILKIEPL